MVGIDFCDPLDEWFDHTHCFETCLSASFGQVLSFENDIDVYKTSLFVGLF